MPFGAMAGANDNVRPGLRREFMSIGRAGPVRGRAGVRRVPRVVLVIAAEKFSFCDACCGRDEGNYRGYYEGATDRCMEHFGKL